MRMASVREQEVVPAVRLEAQRGAGADLRLLAGRGQSRYLLGAVDSHASYPCIRTCV